MTPPNLNLFDLSGRTALITGASSGIGFALAGGLARAGARVVLNARGPENSRRPPTACARRAPTSTRPRSM